MSGLWPEIGKVHCPSLMSLVPWFFLLGISLVFLGVFYFYCKVSRGSPGEKILGIFEVFLDIFEKTNEKKDRVGENTGFGLPQKIRFSGGGGAKTCIFSYLLLFRAGGPKTWRGLSKIRCFMLGCGFRVGFAGAQLLVHLL